MPQMPRKSYPPDFKQETASLVLDQGYTRKAAAEAMGVGYTALDRWVRQLRQERSGEPPEKGYSALNVGHAQCIKLVDILSADYSKRELSQVFDIPRSTYYSYQERKSTVNTERERLKAKVVWLHQASRQPTGGRQPNVDRPIETARQTYRALQSETFT